MLLIFGGRKWRKFKGVIKVGMKKSWKLSSYKKYFQNEKIAKTVSLQSMTISPNKPQICAGAKNGELFSHERCDSYYECNGNRAYEGRCPPEFFFESTMLMCIPDFIVNCGTRRVPGESSVNGGQALPNFSNVSLFAENSEKYFINFRQICDDLPSGTRISNPDNCQSYFECRNRQRILLNCPASTSFDVSTSQCRENSLVNCIQRNGIQNEICQGQRDGRRFMNPIDCSDFFECKNGQRANRKCPNGQLYNHLIESCAPSKSVSCGSRRIPEYQNNEFDENQLPCARPGNFFFYKIFIR